MPGMTPELLLNVAQAGQAKGRSGKEMYGQEFTRVAVISNVLKRRRKDGFQDFPAAFAWAITQDRLVYFNRGEVKPSTNCENILISLLR